MSLLKKTIAAGVALTTLASATVVTTAPAEARGWGAPFAGGLIGGLAAGALIGAASRPAYGYGYAPVYAAPPVYAPPPPVVYESCYRRRVPVYDAYGDFAGYRHERICD